MKMERIAHNKIKIFLTMDDLLDRGITYDDIAGTSLKVQKLFQEMVEEACDSLCFKMNGSVALEIFTLPAQGLMIIITKEADEYFADEDEFNLRVKFDHYPHILYVFEDFEDIIQLSHRLKNQELLSSTLYFYNERYYLLIENVLETVYDKVISLAAEYGNVSTLTLYRMNEYGACLIKNKAIQVVTSFFRQPTNL
jgi:adapter protein MecA 1/2